LAQNHIWIQHYNSDTKYSCSISTDTPLDLDFHKLVHEMMKTI